MKLLCRLQHTIALGCIQHRGPHRFELVKAGAKAYSNMQLAGSQTMQADTSSRAASQAALRV